jgi:hypothetical protein
LCLYIVSVIREDNGATRLLYLRRTGSHTLRARGFAYCLDLRKGCVFSLETFCEVNSIVCERCPWLTENVIKLEIPLLLLLGDGWFESRRGKEALS